MKEELESLGFNSINYRKDRVSYFNKSYNHIIINLMVSGDAIYHVLKKSSTEIYFDNVKKDHIWTLEEIKEMDFYLSLI